MDDTCSVSFKNKINRFLLAPILLLICACGSENKFEEIIPAKTETCGGQAIKSRYIVSFKDGSWDYIENSDRENFKENYVKPLYSQINFIEYDQKIATRERTVLDNFSGIDNWGIESTAAYSAWQKNIYGEGVTVAVIDSGVDIHHRQLSSQIAINIAESGENSGNGIDDDGNGYVDDFAGYNFFDNNNDVSDSSGHGTHVTGIIAATHSDTTLKTGYVQGVAPKAKIIPIKFIGDDGGRLSDALRGIDYAVKQGAQVINASWGGPGCSTALRQKLSEISAQNVLFVAAAGNNGSNLDNLPEYPAAFNLPLMLTVGYIRISHIMDANSNFSRNLVHLFAPGATIVSTFPGDSYISFSGTSMAAPFVSGASALLLGRGLSIIETRRRILDSVTVHSQYANITQGRLNIGNAVSDL